LNGPENAAASDAASVATQNVFHNGALLLLSNGFAWLAGPIGGAAAVIFDILNEIFDFFGGGGNPPIPRQLLHKRHPLYPAILGISDGIVVTEGSAAPDPDPDNKAPLQKTPVASPSATPSPTPTPTTEPTWSSRVISFDICAAYMTVLNPAPVVGCGAGLYACCGGAGPEAVAPGCRQAAVTCSATAVNYSLCGAQAFGK